MSYSPPGFGLPTPKVLMPVSDPTFALAALGHNGVPVSGPWTPAGLAAFYPVYLDAPRTYVKAFWHNGATAAGNVDVGIYTISGATATRVVASTAEAQGTVSTLQVAATFASTTIGPGLYYLAVSSSLATATFWRSLLTAQAGKAAGCFQAASSHPLPATATVVSITATAIPVFGFSENTVI